MAKCMRSLLFCYLKKEKGAKGDDVSFAQYCLGKAANKFKAKGKIIETTMQEVTTIC
jgi:hypothetical protein